MSQEYEVSVRGTDDKALLEALNVLIGLGLRPTFRPVHADAVSADDAAVVATKHQPRITYHVKKKRSGNGSSQWERLIGFCNPGQIDLLRAIKRLKNPTTAVKLSEQLGIRTSTFAGRLNGGLQKNIAKAGYEVSDVIVIGQDDKPITYLPGKVLAANDVNPPGGQP